MRSSEKAVKRVLFNNCTFCVGKNVYEPAEDTFLLAENLVVDEHDVVLDMGTGCGILGLEDPMVGDSSIVSYLECPVI